MKSSKSSSNLLNSTKDASVYYKIKEAEEEKESLKNELDDLFMSAFGNRKITFVLSKKKVKKTKRK